MQIFLLDSDILIDILRGDASAIFLLQDLKGKEVYITKFSEAELIVGARNKKELKNIESLTALFGILNPNALISDLAIKILKKYHLAHGTGIIDSFIAATAIEHNLIFYSKNQKHFKSIEKLKFEKPY